MDESAVSDFQVHTYVVFYWYVVCKGSYFSESTDAFLAYPQTHEPFIFLNLKI
jgi:hypothetical protein